MQTSNLLLALSLAATVTACGPGEQSTSENNTTQDSTMNAVEDPHSFANPAKAVITHLDLKANLDFDHQIIKGTATYDFKNNNSNEILFDVGPDMEILAVTNPETEEELEFQVSPGNDNGGKLSVQIDEDQDKVQIAYKTDPDAAALMWLNPQQTYDKKSPFLFTQGQAILTRTWIPIQDSPGIRITYDATITAPKGMLVVMSAENPQEKNDSGTYTFKMDQPIPPYLMALAAGDLAFESVGKRTGVYAEPGMLEKAVYEFGETEKMVEAAEDLYGPYRWERYDLIVLPPSFPFGGMENPRLTFVTPTVVAGDRSLTSLIAHELAHSWSGNLVTNATWNDFWLNEGFTVYIEKRIMEELYGRNYAEMLNQLGYQDLQNTIHDLGEGSADTKLKLDLEGRNPDDGMTDIAYEKGYLMLRTMEETFGRDRFDKFLRNYFDDHAFESITTEEFIEYTQENLIAKSDTNFDLQAWIYEPGIPENHAMASSDLFQKVEVQLENWKNGADPASLNTAEWSTHEWLHFLRGIKGKVEKERLTKLDNTFHFTNSGNSEIQAEWFRIAIQNNYLAAFPALREFLLEVGRRKFLEPLYRELAKTPQHLRFAENVYNEARQNYHAVSVETIDKILDYQEAPATNPEASGNS